MSRWVLTKSIETVIRADATWNRSDKRCLGGHPVEVERLRQVLPAVREAVDSDVDDGSTRAHHLRQDQIGLPCSDNKNIRQYRELSEILGLRMANADGRLMLHPAHQRHGLADGSNIAGTDDHNILALQLDIFVLKQFSRRRRVCRAEIPCRPIRVRPHCRGGSRRHLFRPKWCAGSGKYRKPAAVEAARECRGSGRSG